MRRLLWKVIAHLPRPAAGAVRGLVNCPLEMPERDYSLAGGTKLARMRAFNCRRVRAPLRWSTTFASPSLFNLRIIASMLRYSPDRARSIARSIVAGPDTAIPSLKAGLERSAGSFVPELEGLRRIQKKGGRTNIIVTDPLLKISEVKALTGIGKLRSTGWCAAGIFPRPICPAAIKPVERS